MKNGLPAWLKLALIALVAGLLLGFTNELTAPAITAQSEMQAQEARRIVLPQAESFEMLDVPADSGIDSCYEGKSGGATAGYVTQVTAKGYGGEIEVVVGLGADGVITGISVGGPNFSETMGLGAKVREAAFTGQFQGQRAPLTLGGNSNAASSTTASVRNPSEANGNVDAVTSATVSSRAVVGAVNTACEYVRQLLEN